jgi:toxin YoeB
MKYRIDEAPGVEKVLKKWKKSNPQLFKKYNKIYH